MTGGRPRRRSRARFGAASFAAAMSLAVVASAQPGTRQRPPPTRDEPARTTLKAHAGTAKAARLVRSADPSERIRGIERAGSIGTPEAVALLVDALERVPQLRTDSRALLTMARTLARFAHRERARTGLLAIVGSAGPDIAGRLPRGSSGDLGDSDARVELAREVAALALARSEADRALESLYAKARAGGSGQRAALLALSAHPPREPGFFGTTGTSMPIPVIRLMGQIGDLRALDVLHLTFRSSDVQVRSAALVALAELGDHRAAALARGSLVATDVRLRTAAAEALVLLGAPDRVEAVAALLSDDATALDGLELAERVHAPPLTKLVAARATQRGRAELRVAATRALGRSPDPDAAKALVRPELVSDGELAYHALSALARSPAPNAGALLADQLAGSASALAARAYVVRALVRGERTSQGDDAIAALARSRAAGERALGVFARVALGDADAAHYLDDSDPRVRRAAAMGSLARRPSRKTERALLARAVHEPDPVTRQVLAAGLLGGDPEAVMKTSMLVDRAESGGGDAPLAVFALARRADERLAKRVDQLLRSSDMIVRAHAARGLALAPLPDATGRLANAYAFETEPEVRRSIVSALVARTEDADAPARRKVLEIAAEVDPDALVRAMARRGLSGASATLAPVTTEVAWVRLARAEDGTKGEPFAGAMLRSDGIAVPFAFDDEGHALVPGLPPGNARVVLAPRLPTYERKPKP